MSEILKVLNRKVELKSEVVELGAAQDAEKALAKALKSISNIDSIGKKAVASAEKLENDIDKLKENAEKLADKLDADIRKQFAVVDEIAKVGTALEKASKELGVDVNSIPVYKKLEKAMNDVSNEYDNVQKDLVKLK